MRLRLPALYALAIVCGAATSAQLQAATINWSLTDFDTTTLDLSGTVIEAVNIGPADVDVTIGADTVTFVAGNPGFTAGPSGITDPPPEYANVVGNDGLIEVLQSHGWTGGGPGTAATLTLTDLFPGVEYEIQAIMHDGRDCCAARLAQYSDGQGNDTAFWGRGDGAIGIGTFTADGPTQDFFVITSPDEGNTDPGMSGYVLRANIDPGQVDAVVDRDTGQISITNNLNEVLPNADLNILGYSVLSSSGSLSQASWNTVAGNTDANGDGSVDADDAWVVLSNPDAHGDLSEAELSVAGGDGGTLGTGESLNMGSVWIQNPMEDIQVDLLLGNGTILNVGVSYSGNGDQPFANGDLNFDGAINADDWSIYIAGAQADLSDLSSAEAYQMGDLNYDGVNNIRDQAQFVAAFEAANGAGSFEAMLASVPEPTTIGLMALGCIAMVSRRMLRWTKLGVVAAVVAMCVMITPQAQAASVIWGDAFPILTDEDVASFVRDKANPDSIIAALNSGETGDPVDVTLPGVSYTITFEPDQPFGGNNTGAGGINTNPYANAGLEAVFDSHSWQGGNPPDPVEFTFDNLVVGQDYELLITGAVDDRGCCLDRGTQFQDTADGSGSNSPPVHRSIDVGGLRYAEAVVASWRADATTQSFWLNSAPLPEIQNDPGSSFMLLQLGGPPITLTALVDTVTGGIALTNGTEETFEIKGYELTSEGGSLNASGWNSLSDQNLDSIGNGVGESWDEAGGASEFGLQEGFLLGSTTFSPDDEVVLGAAYNASSGLEDLLFNFQTAGGGVRSGIVEFCTDCVDVVVNPNNADFNNDGIVDGTDQITLQRSFGVDAGGDADGDGDTDGDDQAIFNAQFGGAPVAAASAAVPEPGTVALCLIGLVGFLGSRCKLRRLPSGLPALLMCVAACSTAFASSTVDRLYLFGDDAEENGNPGSVLNDDTFDSAGQLNAGNLQDLTPAFGPEYADVSGRPMANGSEVGILFLAEFQTFLEGDNLNLPSASEAAVDGEDGLAPEDYTGISNRGFQLWVQPASATGPQSIVMDSNQHGLRISDEGTWSMRYNGGDFDSELAATPDEWVHAMVVRPFGPTGSNSGSRLYINGVAVAAAAGGYNGGDTAPLVVGANTSAVFEEVGTTEFFDGTVDDLSMFIMGANGTADYGSFNLGEDNEFVASMLTGVAGDINQDNVLDQGDVDALVAGWRTENLVNGVRAGDLNTLANGDLNFDGITDLSDAFALHEALVAATGAGLDFSVLNSAGVPEPSTIVLLSLAGGAFAVARKRRTRAA